jgi:TPR repeat protein
LTNYDFILVDPAAAFGAIFPGTLFFARVCNWEVIVKKAAFLLCLILVGCVAALLIVPDEKERFNKGLDAHNRGDYETALFELQPLADQGNVDAQNILGIMYFEGQGVPQDYAEALQWRRLAAEQRNAHAQYNLGFMYNKGQGVPQDYAEALEWYRLAAAQGHAHAPNNIAWILATAPDARVRNGAEALRLAQQAVETGADGVAIDTLAAAFAEVGLFEKAVAEQQRAIDMARAAGDLDAAADRESRLVLYRSRQPYRE